MEEMTFGMSSDHVLGFEIIKILPRTCHHNY